MTGFGYDTDSLRTGAAHAHAAAQDQTQAHAALRDVPTASPFGSSPAAGALHGAVTHAQHVHALGAARASEHLGQRSGRVRTGAVLGDENTARTAGIAGARP